MKKLFAIISLLLLSVQLAFADASTPTPMDWQVDGLARTAIVYIPTDAKTKDSPVVFDFHGHGGTAKNSARTHDFQKQWPEAICVYMQGLPTKTKLDPDGKKPGWDYISIDESSRDVKFFDAVLATLKKDYKVDTNRIYCTGHSNGGVFTYVLWSARADVFAAMGPVAGVSFKPLKDFKPLPAIHVAGETDNIVSFAGQIKTMEGARKLNQCDSIGKPWATAGKLVGTIYPSETNTPFVSLIHPGGHQYPAETAQMIVKFFKEHTKESNKKK